MLNQAKKDQQDGLVPFADFRVSGIRTMNDPRDGSVAIQMGTRLIELLFDVANLEIDREEWVSAATGKVYRSILDTKVFCLSTQSDQLAMYRSYCGPHGVCIEYDLAEVFECAKTQSNDGNYFFPTNCRYVNVDVPDELDGELFRGISRIFEEYRRTPAPEYLEFVRELCGALSVFHAPSYKEEGSEYEKEVRMVVKAGAALRTEKYDVTDTEYEFVNGQIRERAHIKFKLKKSPLKSITLSSVGFNNDNIDPLILALERLGLENCIRLSTHKVKS